LIQPTKQQKQDWPAEQSFQFFLSTPESSAANNNSEQQQAATAFFSS